MLAWFGFTQVQPILRTNKNLNYWPFQQQPASKSQSHPKWLWEDAEPGFCNLEGLGYVVLVCYLILSICKSLHRIMLIT